MPIMNSKAPIDQIKAELDQIIKEAPKLKLDSAFVLWFLRAYISDSPEKTRGALTGESGDKNVDAILIDEKAKQVHVVQGKFRKTIGEHTESRNDVLSFADIACLPWETKDGVDQFFQKLTPAVQEKITEMIRCVRKNRYALRLYFVTTGRVSRTVSQEAAQRLRNLGGPAEIFMIEGVQYCPSFP